MEFDESYLPIEFLLPLPADCDVLMKCFADDPDDLDKEDWCDPKKENDLIYLAIPKTNQYDPHLYVIDHYGHAELYPIDEDVRIINHRYCPVCRNRLIPYVDASKDDKTCFSCPVCKTNTVSVEV